MIRLFQSIIVIAVLAGSAAAQTDTTTTYQGRLTDAGNPANGAFDLEFSLWDAASGGNPIGLPQVLSDTPVDDGLFTVQIDFGSDALDNSDRWLEITVNGIALSPRQPITRAPYSIQTRGIVVDANKNVGIGTSTPAWEFEVANLTAGDGAESAVTADDAGGAIAAYSSTLPPPFAHYAGRVSLFSDAGTMGLDLRADAGLGDLRFYTGGFASSNERMRLTHAGTLGLGTTSPDPLFTLDVAGGIKSTGGAGGVDGYSWVSGVFMPQFAGVYGEATNLSTNGYLGGIYGAYGLDGDSGNFGFLGGEDVGVQGENSAGNFGWLGGAVSGAGGVRANGNHGYIGATYYGVYGYVTDAESYGVYGYSESNRGVFGGSSSGWAGYFAGDVHVTGNLSKGGGGFKIDHPLEPATKYLYHSLVESPDMMNVYNGNVVLDERGEATVDMPEWFEALNGEFRYQLTAIGRPAPNLHIAEEIVGNRFRIAGGESEMKVSWQVTGIRHDAWAEDHRLQVEVEKDGDERGRYLHPSENGVSETAGVNYEEEKRMEAELKSVKAAADGIRDRNAQ